jgi:hypothetical protein
MYLELRSRPTADHGSRGLCLSCPLEHPLSHPSRSYAALSWEEERNRDPQTTVGFNPTPNEMRSLRYTLAACSLATRCIASTDCSSQLRK